MSAPAALACAKLLYPEMEESHLSAEEIRWKISKIKMVENMDYYESVKNLDKNVINFIFNRPDY